MWEKTAWEGKWLCSRYCGSSWQFMTSHCQGLGSPGIPDAEQPRCPAVPSQRLSCANATGGPPHLLGWENCSHDWNQELICGLLLLFGDSGWEERRCYGDVIHSWYRVGETQAGKKAVIQWTSWTKRGQEESNQPGCLENELVGTILKARCPLEITFLEAITVLYTKTPKRCNKN